MSRSKVVITGGSGFIGSQLAQIFSDLAFEVVSIDPNVISNLIPGVNYINRDINIISDKELENLIHGSTLVHLAALSSSPVCEENPTLAIRANLDLTMKLISISNRTNSQIIFASSEWVYPDSTSPTVLLEEFQVELDPERNFYSMTKLVGEWMVKRYSKNYQILRFGIVYGERKTPQSAIEKIVYDAVKISKVQVGNFQTARCFIHVEDLCLGIAESVNLNSKNATFNLAGEKLVSLSEIVKEVEEILNYEIEKIDLGQSPSIRNPVSESFCEIHNWRPKVSISEGIHRLVNSYQSESRGENKDA